MTHKDKTTNIPQKCWNCNDTKIETCVCNRTNQDCAVCNGTGKIVCEECMTEDMRRYLE